MKLPRWLVNALLTTSVLSVLAAAGCWWATWPDRTVSTYLDYLAVDGDRIDNCEPQPRSFVDIILARRMYEVYFFTNDDELFVPWRLFVQGNSIRHQ